MYTKKCYKEPEPPPPEPDPCDIQRRLLKIKAGVKFCPKEPPPPPPPEPKCLAICIEKIKNPPIDPELLKQPIICKQDPATFGTPHDKCDAIREREKGPPDLPWPGCPVIPPPPPPPTPDLCELQDKRLKKEECLERSKRYRE